MNVRHFTISGLRILGIFCLVQSILTTHGLVIALTMGEEFDSQRSQIIFGSLYPSIVLLVVGLLLILFAPRLANRLTPEVDNSQPSSTWTLEGFQAALFSAVGLIIFSSAIPTTFQWLSQLFALPAEDPRKWARHDTKISIILSTIEFSVGIGLFFGGHIISRFLLHLRNWSPNKNHNGT